MNARTLISPHKQLELCTLAKKYKIDIIGIQGRRIGASMGGVGVLLSPFTNKAMISIKKISDRTLQVTFNGNPKTTVIVTYSPTNVSNENKVIDYFNELNETVKSIPAHNFLTIVGDFYSRIGLNNVKFAYHEQTNRNGELMLEFVQENNLVIIYSTV